MADTPVPDAAAVAQAVVEITSTGRAPAPVDSNGYARHNQVVVECIRHLDHTLGFGACGVYFIMGQPLAMTVSDPELAELQSFPVYLTVTQSKG